MNLLDKERIALQVLRDVQDGVIVLENDGRIFMANNVIEEIFEKPKPQMLGQPLTDAIEDIKANSHFLQSIQEHISEESDEVYKKVVPLSVGGKKKYLKIQKSNLHEGKQVIGSVIVLSDISDTVASRQKQQSMEQMEAQNRQLKESYQYIRDAFSQFMSDEIANEILDAPEGRKAGGTKRNITVMMSDLRGFTALCEQIDGDQVMDMLNHYLRRMGKIIKENNGTIISYSGDGILAIFGALIDSENHALDAVLCALKMQQDMDAVNAWNKEHGYPSLKMGIGLNTGDAVIGNMGSQYAMRYNLIGSCVNLCGRIEGYTVAGQVFISPSTRELIPYELMIDDRFEVHPKGILKPLEISSVRGIGEPYNLSIQYKAEKLIPLKNPDKVRVYQMNGKKIPKNYTYAYILEQSHRQLVFTSEEALAVHDDLMIRWKVDVYGKIIKAEGNRYLLEITGRAKRS